MNKACKIVYGYTKLPVISDREFFILGEGIDRMEENNTIVIISRTIDHVIILNSIFLLTTKTKYICKEKN